MRRHLSNNCMALRPSDDAHPYPPKAAPQGIPVSGGGGAAAFSPDDIANMKLWLDAIDSTFVKPSERITDMSDLSGLGYDAYQTTSSREPLYEAAGLNGHPSVLCNADGLYLPAETDLNPEGEPFFVAAVVEFIDLNSHNFVYANRESCLNFQFHSDNSQSDKIAMLTGSTCSSWQSNRGAAPATVTPMVVFFELDGSGDSQIYIDNVAETMAGATNDPVYWNGTDKPTIGGTQNFANTGNLRFSALIVYKGALPTSDERSDLFDYLSARYSI